MGNSARLHFLDGLRGWAALVVVFSHLFQVWLLNPACLEENGSRWLLDLINATPAGVLMDGDLAVFVFFCISGVALSYPILRSNHPTRTALTMAAVRYPRLATPIIASCGIIYVAWSAGLLWNQAAGEASSSAWLASCYRFPAGVPLFWRFVLVDVFVHYDRTSTWNVALWTMPIELAGSFGIFLGLLVLRARRWRIAAAIVACLVLLPTFYFGFAAGLLIAELIVQRPSCPPMIASGVLLAALALAILNRCQITFGP